jgi:hypothetical protein
MNSAPWETEPLRWEGEASGFPILAIRHEEMGNWTGYVGLPHGHPCHGANYTCPTLSSLDVHGKLTFSNVGDDLRPSGWWWVGFDCGHAGDFIPAIMEIGLNGVASVFADCVYRDLQFVQTELTSLAAQLAVIFPYQGPAIPWGPREMDPMVEGGEFEW